MNRDEFQIKTSSRTASELALLVAQSKQGAEAARNELCATLAWAAFAEPAATQSVYDHIANAWLDTNLQLDTLFGQAQDSQLDDIFWTAFWSMIDDAEQGYDATSITLRAAGMGAYVDEGFGIKAETVARNHAGVTTPEDKTVPGLISLDLLQALPPESLGHDLYKMWTENNFDPEVLNRESIGLSALPPALRYLNTRILQMHDVWHLVAGYETTALHEVAISSFQLAQFGHNYSAMFLATSLTIAGKRSPEGFGLLMHVVSEAWQHGRSSPNFMNIEWEDHWHKPIAALRAELEIRPFNSMFPANTIELAMAAQPNHVK
jgi:ubiquinone biosynthesis protein Coq4